MQCPLLAVRARKSRGSWFGIGSGGGVVLGRTSVKVSGADILVTWDIEAEDRAGANDLEPPEDRTTGGGLWVGDHRRAFDFIPHWVRIESRKG